MENELIRIKDSKYWFYQKDETLYIKNRMMAPLSAVLSLGFSVLAIILVLADLKIFIDKYFAENLLQVIIGTLFIFFFCILLPVLSLLSLLWKPVILIVDSQKITYKYLFFFKKIIPFEFIDDVFIDKEVNVRYFRMFFKQTTLSLFIRINKNYRLKLMGIEDKERSKDLEKVRDLIQEKINKSNKKAWI